MISTKKNSYTTNVSPESRLSETQDASDIFFKSHIGEFPFSRWSREQLYEELAVSRKQAHEGKLSEMGQALKELRIKYGL